MPADAPAQIAKPRLSSERATGAVVSANALDARLVDSATIRYDACAIPYRHYKTGLFSQTALPGFGSIGA